MLQGRDSGVPGVWEREPGLSHFYQPDGTLVAHVPNKSKPGTHETTIRDARLLGLYPSVTTILSLLNKPMLNDWRIKQGVEAALASPGSPVDALVKAADYKANQAAEMGTAIHGLISDYLKGEPESGLNATARLVVRGFKPWYEMSGLVCEESEMSFVSEEHGWAGTIDFKGWLNGKRIIADWKSQDAETEAEAHFHEPEYPLQFAGYAVGAGLQDHERWTFVVSRTRPGAVFTKKWEEPERWDRAFGWLANLWFELKNYDPRREG